MKAVIAADHSVVNVADADDLAALRKDIADLRAKVEALEALAENPSPPEPKELKAEDPPQND